MTELEFEEYIQTADGDAHYYEFLYDEDPSLGKHGIIRAMEDGYLIEEFMDHLGVERDDEEV